MEVNGLFPRNKLLINARPLVFSSSISILNQKLKHSGTTLTWYRYNWSPDESITKRLENGLDPSWSTVRQRYWKKRYQNSKNTGEFDLINLKRMQDGLAPIDYSFMSYKWESRELHHIVPRAFHGSNDESNLMEVTPDQHAMIDPCRRRKYK